MLFADGGARLFQIVHVSEKVVLDEPFPVIVSVCKAGLERIGMKIKGMPFVGVSDGNIEIGDGDAGRQMDLPRAVSRFKMQDEDQIGAFVFDEREHGDVVHGSAVKCDLPAKGMDASRDEGVGYGAENEL